MSETTTSSLPDLIVPMQVIADAARVEFARVYKSAVGPVAPLAFEPKPVQKHVSLTMDAAHVTSDLDGLLQCYVRPAMQSLADSMPANLRFGELEIPRGYAAARSTGDEISIRVVFGWHFPMLEAGDVAPRLRFDVIGAAV